MKKSLGANRLSGALLDNNIVQSDSTLGISLDRCHAWQGRILPQDERGSVAAQLAPKLSVLCTLLALNRSDIGSAYEKNRSE